ncbi:class I SAM-dependent methyltransferase [Bradyrhizobium sp. MOS002]|uniref:class I SAM-dependent methyltransferase n=1 Tax=Bradyrhizobium sp. MOS002 TaxID=2133947 RepID=UPI000D117E12|nr:class I SAM-dependent methyltransferase [Bradyrhizobium sp. MOS002]PSO16862.1 methyltransferase [Bradyrhizobium sp. MOS002]
MSDVVDRKYYEVIKPASLGERLLIAARDRMFADFLAHTNPSSEALIVDVGVSDVISDAANFLERKYQYKGNITACGLGEASEFQGAFPEVTYKQISANERLPFDDDTFDIATANAVLEHVGSSHHQIHLVGELLRIAKTVFVTVPHRFFPIEHHTAIPLLQYTDISFRLACLCTGKASWSDEQNLILMSWQKLRRIAHQFDCDHKIGYTGLRLGPFSSNLFLFLAKR